MIDYQIYRLCQSFGTLTKFMMQKQFLDFSDRLAIRKSDFLKRKHLIFPTIFCSLSIKSKPIILNANAVGAKIQLLLLKKISTITIKKTLPKVRAT